MGAWGYHSDENDDAHDAMSNIEEKHADVAKAKESLPGVLRILIKRGTKVLLRDIRAAITLLKNEKTELGNNINRLDWNNPEDRIIAIKTELRELNYALKHNGKGPKGETYDVIETILKRQSQ